MVGFYNYTVYATYIGMISAVAGVLFAAEKNTFAAVLSLVLCGIVDAVDGTIARTKKDRTDSEKRFGIEIDSLSDLVAFGVLPAALAFSVSDTVLSRIACLFYALCALIRLAYFDVLAHEKLISKTVNKEYVGLPVTSCAWALPCAVCALPYLSKAFAQLIFPVLLILMAILFITPFKLKKPGIVWLVLGVLLSVCLIFLLIWEHSASLL